VEQPPKPLENKKRKYPQSSKGDGEAKPGDAKPAGTPKKSNQEFNKPCLVPGCGGRHLVSDCPTEPSKEEARKID
jgi:hypothetical protein